LRDEFGVFVTLLDSGTIWRAQIRPKLSGSYNYTREFQALLDANKEKPFIVTDCIPGKKVVYIEDATKSGVLQFVRKVVGGLDFPVIFRSAGNVSSLLTMDFTPLPTDALCLGEYIQSLRKEYVNGSVVLKTFHTNSGPLIQTMINALAPAPLLAYFLALNPSIQSGLEDLKISESPQTLLFAEALDTYRLLGDLLHVLRSGGAYYSSKETLSHDQQVASEFLQALLGKENPGAFSCVLHGAWTSFFFDVAWDSTFIIIDPDAGNVHFLYMTDTD
jgi:hypothetical protein